MAKKNDKQKLEDIKDNIVQVDSREQYNKDMVRYSIYTLMSRYVPNIADGLKPVQRRILTSMFFDLGSISNATKRKCAKITGAVIGDYHPHGDMSCYDAMKPMVNWFESQMPLLANISNFGTLQGNGAGSQRYTETYINQFGVECAIGELAESKKVVDWVPTFDRSKMEPEALATKVPLLLINGCFSIAVGVKIEIPSHNINEVIDATVQLLDNPNSKTVLIPDPPMGCEIVDTNWKQISNMGFGYFTVRGRIDTIKNEKTGVYTLCIKSVPELVFLRV